MSKLTFCRLATLVIASAALSAPALAQTVSGQPLIKRDPHFAQSAGGYGTQRANLSQEVDPGSHIAFGFGRLEEQTQATRRLVSDVAPQFKAAVSEELGNPEGAKFRDLRLGLYGSALVICGTVHADNGNGAVEPRRFIARSSIATLETAENHAAFETGLRRTGCDS